MTPSPAHATNPTAPSISEDALVHYLIENPDFFERNAPLLVQVRLRSPFGQRAVSLQERQAEMLRDKIKMLEKQLMALLRNGNENGVIAERILDWAQDLMGGLQQHRGQVQAYATFIASELARRFHVPQTAVLLWNDPAWSAPGRAWVQGLKQIYCGSPPEALEVLPHLAAPAEVASLAVVPLRLPGAGEETQPVGVLLLASPDSERFHSGIGVDYLERLATLCAVALHAAETQASA